MLDRLKKVEFLKKVSIIYLFVFCLLKLLSLLDFFDEISYNTPMIIIGFIIFAIIVLKNKFKINYPKMLMFFIGTIFMNILFNFDIATIKTDITEIFYVLVIYNIAKEFICEKQYSIILKCVCIITILMLSVFYFNYIALLIKTGIPTKSDIMNLTFSNINGGAILALLSTLMVTYLYREKIINKIIYIISMFYYVIFIIISGSRTALIALLILLFIFGISFVTKKFKNEKIRKICITSFFIVLILSLFLFSSFIMKKNYNLEDKFDKFVYETEKELAQVTTLRYWLWKYSIQELSENNFVFGLSDNFGEYSYKRIMNTELAKKLSPQQLEVIKRNNIHSGYLEILVRNGIAGFAFISMFFYYFFKKNHLNYSKKEYSKYVKYLYLAIFIINFFENDIVLSNTFFVLFLWIQIGMDSKVLNQAYDSKEK